LELPALRQLVSAPQQVLERQRLLALLRLPRLELLLALAQHPVLVAALSQQLDLRLGLVPRLARADQQTPVLDLRQALAQPRALGDPQIQVLALRQA
jgi:hypothetical protein